MASSDIMKQAVFDARIVQMPPRYAVEKGALSVSNAPFRAIGATSSQHNYQVNVPSQNVFVDRAVDWSSYVYLAFKANVLSPAGDAITPIVKFGQNIALSAFPLHELTQTMTATINDTTVTINTDTVLKEVLRLTDYKKNRLVRHCPTMLDRYASYSDATLGGASAVNTPLNGYYDATTSEEVPNGAWGGVDFVYPTGVTIVAPGAVGTILPASASPAYTFTDLSGNTRSVNTNSAGVPLQDISGANGGYPLAIRFYSSEKLVLSPFVFADAHEWETGLFGINNIQLVMNMKSDPARVLRIDTGDITFTTTPTYLSVGNSPFADSRLDVQFLTPSLDLPLPEKSVVSYMEFPRYITTGQSAWQGGETSRVIQSQTIVLPNIPDALVIYCKPQAYADNDDADFYYPITSISLNFDNFSGLMSSMTAEQLYQMSVHNGLEMDWNEWNGVARIGSTGGKVQTVGGFLVIKPGIDFGLQAGQAPSLIGNYTLQFQATVQNRFASALTPVLYVIAVNSGFFESLAGSSRVIKGVLSEADIISAEPIMEMTRDSLNRVVGAGFLGNLGSFLTKAIDVYNKTKPIGQAVKGMLPEGKVKNVMGALGYGMPAGAGMAGAGKKSLSARLM